MYERFYSPNIMALASSQVGEDSLSVSAQPQLLLRRISAASRWKGGVNIYAPDHVASAMALVSTWGRLFF